MDGIFYSGAIKSYFHYLFYFENSPNSSVTTTDEDLVLFYFPEHMESESKILNIKFKPD